MNPVQAFNLISAFDELIPLITHLNTLTNNNSTNSQSLMNSDCEKMETNEAIKAVESKFDLRR